MPRAEQRPIVGGTSRSPIGSSRFAWRSSGLEAPSWLVSLCLHVTLFLILAIGFRPLIQGTNGTVAQSIGVAFVAEVSEGEENGAAVGGEADSPEGGGAASRAILSTKMAVGDGPPMDVSSILTDLQGTGKSAPSAETIGGSGNAIGPGTGGGTKGGKRGGTLTEVNFYDLPGVGNSFVFVIDRSDSMNEPQSAPIRSAKREVSKSLEGLKVGNQFQIIFYNDQPLPFHSKISATRGLIRAQDLEKKLARDFVENVSAFGGTEHLAALNMGINMKPDVLFFLTDAEQPRLSKSELDILVEKCEGSTTIHCVEYGTGPSPARGRWIEALADLTGGQYRYVDVTQLPGK